MAIINMHDAKSQLSDLVVRAEAGEEIVIARHNKPAVRLLKVEAVGQQQLHRKSGALAHVVGDPPTGYDRLFEHAPDDCISKKDIAAYCRKYAEEWQEIRDMVGFGENEQSDYDAGDLPLAIDSSKEYTIMRDGKGFACRPENVRLGRIGRPPRCPTLSSIRCRRRSCLSGTARIKLLLDTHALLWLLPKDRRLPRETALTIVDSTNTISSARPAVSGRKPTTQLVRAALAMNDVIPLP